MTEVDQNESTMASRLRAARESAGLSQGQVARLLGLHRPTVSEMEAGRRKLSAEELVRFAEVYETPVSWLAGVSRGSDNTQNDRLELAARELAKLKPEDLERLLKLLSSLREQDR